MKHSLYRDILKTLFSGSAGWKFFTCVLLGLSFSISVILSTIGIMDGFESTLQAGLKRSNGDITLFSSRGFFESESKFLQGLEKMGVDSLAQVVQSEGFILFNGQNKGVILKGIDPLPFQQVTSLDINVKDSQVFLGLNFSDHYGIKVGDYITLAFAKGNSGDKSLPNLQSFKVAGFIGHGVHKKDSRMVYLSKKDLQQALAVDHRINVLQFNIPSDFKRELKHQDRVQNFLELSREYLEPHLRVRPYWSEFGPLLEAVKVEKVTITMVLQIIVVMAIFNSLAFIIFLNEQKSRDIFLLMALGLNKKQLVKVWSILMIFLWLGSCLLSIVLTFIFDLMLQHLEIFKLPGDIYTLTRLSLDLNIGDYISVYFLAFFWMFLFSLFSLRKLTQANILSRLRKEFA